MTTSEAETALPTSSKVLCAVYGAIAFVALIATWTQNAAYLDNPARFILDWTNDLQLTPASRSVTADILLIYLAAAVLMVVDARKHGVKYVWLYIVLGFVIDFSVTFPLFLIARELRIRGPEPTRMSAADTIGLAIVAVAILSMTVWVDVG